MKLFNFFTLFTFIAFIASSCNEGDSFPLTYNLANSNLLEDRGTRLVTSTGSDVVVSPSIEILLYSLEIRPELGLVLLINQVVLIDESNATITYTFEDEPPATVDVTYSQNGNQISFFVEGESFVYERSDDDLSVCFENRYSITPGPVKFLTLDVLFCQDGEPNLSAALDKLASSVEVGDTIAVW